MICMEGGTTVTVKELVKVLFRQSVAMQVTVVAPAGKSELEGGVQVTVTFAPQKVLVALTLKNTCVPLHP